MKYRYKDGKMVSVDEIAAIAAPDEVRSDVFAEPKSLGDGRWRLIDGEWTPIGGDNGIPEQQQCIGTQIIKDLEPYKPVAAEKHNGQRSVIGGRRQHREFLKRNGYVEIGNDYVAPRREEVSSTRDRVTDIKRAMNTL